MTSPLITAAIACEEAKEGRESLDLAVYSALFPETKWAAVPKLTQSLDAIAALTAELLPGWMFEVGIHSDKRASVYMEDGNGNAYGVDWCATEPLARCVALLRALEERK